MKKYINIITFLFLFTFIFSIEVFAKSSEPQFTFDGVVLMDATTGKILYSKNIDTAYAPASTTKVMTALLTLENCKLTDVVTVGKNPPLKAAGGSHISLLEGENLTVEDLLYGLLMQSGNDCAETLAEYIGGNSENFAKIMNERAKKLGCTNTNFVNPSGLYDQNHKTSARDLATMMVELSKHPEFKKISTTGYHVISPNNKYPEGHPMSNNNKIVTLNNYHISGYEGGKTGYTVESLHSFTAVANRNGQKLVVAFLHGNQGTHLKDAKTLFEYGFDNFELVKLYTKGTKVMDYNISKGTTLPLVASEDYFYAREKGSTVIPKSNFDKINIENKSFKKGDPVLTLNYSDESGKLKPLSLNSGENHILKEYAKNNTVRNIIFSLLTLVLLLFLACLFIRKHNLKKRKRRKKVKTTNYTSYF